jgi:hypothetical protein
MNLSDEDKATRHVRLRLRMVGMGLVGSTCAGAAIWMVSLCGKSWAISMLGAGLALVSFECATLFLFLADVQIGKRSAIRGGIVGSIAGSFWLGWGSAWTAGVSSPILFTFGSGIGVFVGAVFGALAGVFVGGVLRALKSMLSKSRQPELPVHGGLHDQWLDGP